MKQDIVFFGTEGLCLSSTSANHVANLAKEFVKRHLRVLEGMHFTDKKVGALGLDAQSVLQKGTGEDELMKVGEKLTEIGEANSLIAWLREGIKAKKAYLEYVENATEEDYCAMMGIDPQSRIIEEPDYEKFVGKLRDGDWLEKPEKPTKVSTEEVLDGWEETKRLNYHALLEEYEVLDLVVFQLGEKIHQLMEVQDEPVRSVGVGDQITIFQKHPTVKVEKVDETLQHFVELRRGVGRKLAELSKEISDEIRKRYDLSVQKYHEDMVAYEKEKLQKESIQSLFDLQMEQYHKAVSEQRNELKTFRVKKGKEVGNLKIVIPASLKGIYQKVAALGKE